MIYGSFWNWDVLGWCFFQYLTQKAILIYLPHPIWGGGSITLQWALVKTHCFLQLCPLT